MKPGGEDVENVASGLGAALAEISPLYAGLIVLGCVLLLQLPGIIKAAGKVLNERKKINDKHTQAMAKLQNQTEQTRLNDQKRRAKQ